MLIINYGLKKYEIIVHRINKNNINLNYFYLIIFYSVLTVSSFVL